MAMLSKSDFSFAKPYLSMLAESIESKTPVKFKGGVSQVVNQTEEVKRFVSAVKNQNTAQLNAASKIGTKYSPIFNGYKWSDIDKSPFSGQGGGAVRPDGKTTAMQENASLFAIQKGIENNGYSNKENFLKLYRKDLQAIYPAMDEYWEHVFFEQQKLTQQKVGSTRYNHYSRDGGFMDYITNTCKSLYGIGQKDTWNPADIWLVADYNKAKRDLDSKIRDNITSLPEFNAILQDMFNSRQVVGISLKKMSGRTARWELVNFEGMDVFDGDDYMFKFQDAKCNLSVRGTEFANTESSFSIASSKVSISFQIRQNSRGFNNLKLEGTDVSARAARLGKAPLDMVSAALRSYGVTNHSRWRSWRNYPSNLQEFQKEQSVHVARFKSLKSTRKVALSINTEKDFIDNMTKVFESAKTDNVRAVANSKLMQLDLLNEIFSLSSDTQISNLLSDISYLAQKKGALFGPFAKLY